MFRTVAIGLQDFETVRKRNCFYVDKTDFIREWWEADDDVTLITRPRRFGKTLNMSMLEKFFSIEYAGRDDLFKGLSIWKDEKYRKLQGTYPVIFLSFANVKGTDYQATRKKICQLISKLYTKNAFLLNSDVLYEIDKDYFRRVRENMDDSDASLTLYQLSDFLYRYYGKKSIILLDEYDTPMQEAYVNGYWDELVSFTRDLFNSTFKTNPCLERGIMTGITRVSKESIFSDLNNLEIVTTTSEKYATSFGFTEEEVFNALDEYGYSSQKEEVKNWYDGFTFGSYKDIYNPWSILNFLDKGKTAAYWANTSSNSLIGKLIREGNGSIKKTFEDLMKGNSIQCAIDEQIVFNQLNGNEDAVWSLMIAAGYLKVLDKEPKISGKPQMYTLSITNAEVYDTFSGMIKGWFSSTAGNYNDFVKALLRSDLKEMNAYMKRIVTQTFSYFDTEGKEPELFYHAFVLGIIVELNREYVITSNRESGFGRYDVMIAPKNNNKDAMILEFKVCDHDDEKTLEDTVKSALKQIDEKQYEATLVQRGFHSDRIKKYGFAFEGKKVLIGDKHSFKENRDSGSLKKLNAF